MNNSKNRDIIKNILITGNPGAGKTTLIRGIISDLNVSAGGFYTAEIRDDRGRRQGFKVISLDGQEDMLASVDIVSNNKVSKYGVNIAAMERVGVPAIRDALDHRDIVVIDEIGRMELFSRQFRNVVTQVLDSPKPVLGTVAVKSVNFIKKAGERSDTKIIKLTRANGSEIDTHIRRLLEKLNIDGK